MNQLEIFGFRAMWSPYLFCILLGITAIYLYFYRRMFSKPNRITGKEMACFLSAMLFLYAAEGSPVDLLGHIMFSAHMVQMAVLYLVVPPLLIAGIPAWLWEKIIFRPAIKPVFSFFAKPLIALLLFNGIFSLYHVPLIFDTVKTDPFYHTFITWLIFVLAFFMWWPLVHKVGRLRQLSGLMKLGYIMADGMLLTPACALIMFSGAPLYATYTDPSAWAEAMSLCVPADMMGQVPLTGPEMLNTLPLLEDQQLGAVMMKIIQEIVYGTFLAIIFFQWVKKEREKDGQEEPPYIQQTIS
ncbi:cytochrome c oxidase assembly factor CtaG [Bacillus subtilis]|nr:cytochrome c oxidase assembly factor CtaG [Bacillus subtilis]